MKTMSPDSAHSGAVRLGQPVWRRLVAVMLIALLSPIPALFAFWADASGDGAPDTWIDPASGHVFTLSELNAFSDDIDGDGLSNAQEMAIGTNPFSPDTDGDGISDLLDSLPLSAANLSPSNGIAWGAIALDDADGDGVPNFLDQLPYGLSSVQIGSPDTDGDGISDIIDPAPGVTWNGDTGMDYHKAVFQAFQTGDGLRAALGLPAGADITVAAHSLGNMVVSHAIQSGGFRPQNYFMINAAVPLEAYDPTVLEQKGLGSAYEVMTEFSWKGKDPRLFASNWHGLFDGYNDSRGRLKWEGIFCEIAHRPGVINFYSPGEDVVQNPTSSSSLIIWDMIKNLDIYRGAWGHQEMIKGGGALGGLPFSRVQGGWRLWNDRDVLASTSNEELQTRPLFQSFLELDLLSEDEGTGSIKAAESRVLHDLLARGVPALSFAAAANEIPSLGDSNGNFNMESNGRVLSMWPAEAHGGDREGKWIHSDFKNVALPYVFLMYQEMIFKGGLSTK